MDLNTESAKSQFETFIIEQDHPCLMAQAVVKNAQYQIHDYKRLGDAAHIPQLLSDLNSYLEKYDWQSPDLYTFAAVYSESEIEDEDAFEKLLWRELQLLHDADEVAWDPSVDRDPHSDNFSFSLGGKAFYIVGLHPQSSRMARRSPQPMLIFNLHHQFEMLRQMKVYNKTKKAIRARDKALQGNINPMLADFGKGSEARQYSGKASGKQWECPFKAKAN